MMFSGDEEYGDEITSGLDHQDEPYEGVTSEAMREHMKRQFAHLRNFYLPNPLVKRRIESDQPHASDCAVWCDEACDCLYGKLGDE